MNVNAPPSQDCASLSLFVLVPQISLFGTPTPHYAADFDLWQ